VRMVTTATQVTTLGGGCSSPRPKFTGWPQTLMRQAIRFPPSLARVAELHGPCCPRR
jgi:hypothetical protein